MNIAEFTQKFAACFSDETAASITPETEFKQLEEWGSMLALIVIAMVDSDYGKTIASEDLKAARTVSDLYQIITAR